MTTSSEIKGFSITEPIESDFIDNDFKPDWRFYFIFVSLAIITLAASLDATSLSVALPIIASELHGTAIQAFWTGTSFLLSSTVFMPSYGSLSHIFGRKPLLIVAIILFIIGSIVCATSKNFTSLLVGRSVQGVGAGGVVSLTEILLTDLVPLKERGKWYGLISAVWAVGSVSGPIIGGVFSQSVSWTWIFWINVPIIAIGLIFVLFFLQLQMTRKESFRVQLRRVDWFGTVLFIGATTSLLIPVTWGGVMYSWSSPRTLVPFIIGLLGLAAFGPYEYFVVKEPMVRLSIFHNATSCIVYFQTFIHGIVLWSLLYYGPLFFEGVRGFSPTISGVAMFPETFTIAPVAAIVGIVVAVYGKYRWALWAGWVLTCIGFGLLCLQDAKTPNLGWIALNLVPGLGMGMLFTSLAMAVPAACKPIDMAHATAFFVFFRGFGNSIGVAISGAIFQNQIKLKLSAYPLLSSMAEKYSQDAAALVEIIKVMNHGPMRDQMIQAYADSLKIVWATMSALAGMALISTIWVKAFTLQQSLVTEQAYLHRETPKDLERTKRFNGVSITNMNDMSDSDFQSNQDLPCIEIISSRTDDKIEIVEVQYDLDVNTTEKT